MSKSWSTNGWSLDQGLAAQYAAQAGLDPELASVAGSKAWDVLKSLRDAADELNAERRAKLVRRTRRRLKEAGLGQHRELAGQIAARLDALSETAAPSQPSINPQTGLQEFGLLGRQRRAGFVRPHPFYRLDPFAGRGTGWVFVGDVAVDGRDPARVSTPLDGGQSAAPEVRPPPVGVEQVPVTARQTPAAPLPSFAPPALNIRPNIGAPLLPDTNNVLPAPEGLHLHSEPKAQNPFAAFTHFGLDTVDEYAQMSEQDLKDALRVAQGNQKRHDELVKSLPGQGSPRTAGYFGIRSIREAEIINRIQEACRRKGYAC